MMTSRNGRHNGQQQPSRWGKESQLASFYGYTDERKGKESDRLHARETFNAKLESTMFDIGSLSIEEYILVHFLCNTVRGMVLFAIPQGGNREECAILCILWRSISPSPGLERIILRCNEGTMPATALLFSFPLESRPGLGFLFYPGPRPHGAGHHHVTLCGPGQASSSTILVRAKGSGAESRADGNSLPSQHLHPLPCDSFRPRWTDVVLAKSFDMGHPCKLEINIPVYQADGNTVTGPLPVLPYLNVPRAGQQGEAKGPAEVASLLCPVAADGVAGRGVALSRCLLPMTPFSPRCQPMGPSHRDVIRRT